MNKVSFNGHNITSYTPSTPSTLCTPPTPPKPPKPYFIDYWKNRTSNDDQCVKPYQLGDLENKLDRFERRLDKLEDRLNSR